MSWRLRGRPISAVGSALPNAKTYRKAEDITAQPRILVYSRTPKTLPKLAWLEYLSGNTEDAVRLLGNSAERQHGQPKALSLYYRGAILNRMKRYDQALSSLDQAIAESPDLVLAREERGETLWQLGRKQEAVAAWNDAIKTTTALPIANSMLAGASASQGSVDAAADYEREADRYTPNDPLFHWVLGLRLQNVGMNELAEKHFQRAIQLNPEFRRARAQIPRAWECPRRSNCGLTFFFFSYQPVARAVRMLICRLHHVIRFPSCRQPAFERRIDHLADASGRNDLELFPHIFRDVFDVSFISIRAE